MFLIKVLMRLGTLPHIEGLSFGTKKYTLFLTYNSSMERASVDGNKHTNRILRLTVFGVSIWFT